MVHQGKIYEGIRYSCNLCKFKFTEKGYLKTHNYSLFLISIAVYNYLN